MASSLRSRLSRAFTFAEPATDAEAEKYKLRVTAGGTYDTNNHKTVPVNTEEPILIENEFLRAKIIVRVKGFRGLPSSCPSSAEYFSDPAHERDMYSLAFSFVPKQDLPSVETVWGNDLDHPIRNRIPPGFNTAFRIVKEFIDPGLNCDVYADEPWLYGPSLSCWFGFRIGEKVEDGEDFPAPGTLVEGADGSGNDVREKLNIPDNNEKRRRHFLDASNREAFVFEKGRVYQGDFFNPYIDFANFSLKLPGFSLKVIRYIGEKTHCLRYVFKNRETGELYINVNFNLLWGEELNKAIEDDAELNEKVQQGRLGTDGVDENEQPRPGAEEVRDIGPTSVDEETSNQGESEEGIAAKIRAGLAVEWPGAKQPQSNRIQGTPATSDMQIHPGDHVAAAEALVDQKEVDDIDKTLQATSSAQKRDGLLLDEID